MGARPCRVTAPVDFIREIRVRSAKTEVSGYAFPGSQMGGVHATTRCGGVSIRSGFLRVPLLPQSLISVPHRRGALQRRLIVNNYEIYKSRENLLQGQRPCAAHDHCLRAVHRFRIAPGASNKSGCGFPPGKIGAIREFQFHECTDLRSRVKRWPIDSGGGHCHGRTCSGHPDEVGTVLSHRDRRDEPGDDNQSGWNRPNVVQQSR
jgi:hypothetical protein